VEFDHTYGFQTNVDGGLLEISTNGAPFKEILAAGGSFLSGGYNNIFSSAWGILTWEPGSLNALLPRCLRWQRYQRNCQQQHWLIRNCYPRNNFRSIRRKRHDSAKSFGLSG
jgi:hypothetical protein